MDQTMATLEQLRDLSHPDAISFWPPAFGWWLLALLIIVGFILCLRILLRNHRRRAQRREAIKRIEAICARPQANPSIAAEQLLTVLKQIALSTYDHSRTSLAGLHSERWAGFMDYSCSKKILDKATGEQLTQAIYQPNITLDINKAKSFAITWVKHHRPLEASVIEQWLAQNPNSPSIKSPIAKGEAQHYAAT